MERCRICLENKKNLCSVFDSKQGILYADMIKSVANIKITGDSDKNKLCFQCSRKLKSFYDFKLLIERSDRQLYKHLRIYNFENIFDLKEKLTGKFDITVCENGKNIIKEEIKSYIGILQNGDDNILYNNTVIKKNRITNIDIIQHEETSNDAIFESDDKPLENFNETRTEKTQDIKPQGEEAESSVSEVEKSLKQGSEREKKKNNKKSRSNKICIKPKILHNVGIIRIHYRKKSSRSKDREKRKMCPYCGIMCTNIKSHVMKHTAERKYKCSDCQKRFYTTKELDRHKKLHMSEGSFQCDHCVAVFNNKYTLQRHMITHTDDKKHVCSICNKAFKRPGTLRRHEGIHNSAAKSVMCELCNMSFLHKEGLRHHMRVHTGERPFKCEENSIPLYVRHQFSQAISYLAEIMDDQNNLSVQYVKSAPNIIKAEVKSRHINRKVIEFTFTIFPKICSQPYSYKTDFNRHCLKKHGVFLKRRSVHVLTEEVMVRERELMKDLMLRIQEGVREGEPLNPFQGPQAAQAFQYALKYLESKEISIDML